jgi:hypothetical protein
MALRLMAAPPNPRPNQTFQLPRICLSEHNCTEILSIRKVDSCASAMIIEVQESWSRTEPMVVGDLESLLIGIAIVEVQ